MKNRWNIGLIIVGIIGLLVIMYFIFLSPNRPKYSWVESYRNNDLNPYGTKYLYETLKESYDSNTFTSIEYSIYDQLDVTDSNSLYFFIGKEILADSEDFATIFEFVQNGNTAFISLMKMPSDLEGQFLEFEYLTGSCLYDSTVEVQFLKYPTEKPFGFDFQDYSLKAKYYWRYYDIDTVKSPAENLTTLSLLNNKECDFLSIKYGKGVFYFHANPVMLSNYFFIHNEGLRYANACFEPINPKKIYWDEVSKIDYPKRNQSEGNESFLRYIFTQPGLKWAWYLLLTGVLFFVVFRSKRTQRIVPLLPENVNSSKEFVKSVALLYLKTNEHKAISAEMIKLFVQFVKIKYGTTVKLDNIQDTITKLSAISGIDAELLNHIFVLKLRIEQTTEKQTKHLKKLHTNIEYFYKNCK